VRAVATNGLFTELLEAALARIVAAGTIMVVCWNGIH